MRQSRHILALLLLCFAIMLACNQSRSSQATESVTSAHGVSPSSAPRYYGPFSLEERIVVSDAIAIADIQSVLVGSEFYREFGGTSFYKPLVEVRYYVIEYLKDDGGNEVVAKSNVSRRYAYESRESVMEEAWETAKGIIGHNREHVPEGFSCGKPPFENLMKNGGCQGNIDLSDVSLRNERFIVFFIHPEPYRSEATGTATEQSNRFLLASWMPVVVSDSQSGASSMEQRFRIVGFPSDDPQSAFTRSEVRKRVAEIDTLLKSGEDIPDYRDCLRRVYYKRRSLTWDINQNGDKYSDSDVAELKERLETQTVSKQCPR